MWIGNYKIDFYSFSYLMKNSKRQLIDIIKCNEKNLINLSEECKWLHKSLDRAMDTICCTCEDKKFGVENCTECVYLKHDDGEDK